MFVSVIAAYFVVVRICRLHGWLYVLLKPTQTITVKGKDYFENA